MALLNELPVAVAVELEVIQASSCPSCLVMVKVWFEMAVRVCECEMPSPAGVVLQGEVWCFWLAPALSHRGRFPSTALQEGHFDNSK